MQQLKCLCEDVTQFPANLAWFLNLAPAAQVRERKEREAAAKERERGAELEQVDDHDYGDHVHHYQNMKYFKRSNEPDKW